MSLKHFLLFIVIHSFLLMTGIVLLVFAIGPALDLSCANWDVYWFRDIAYHGYFFDQNNMSSVAFFPLLPWFIRLLQFNSDLIQFVLIIISVSSLGLLTLLSKDKTKDTLLFLAGPLLFYFLVPYTEALFLLGSTLLLIGLHKRQLAWLVAGAFIAILSRYAAMLLLPALILTASYDLLQRKESLKAIFLLYGAPILTLILGLVLVSYIQYLDTGVWNGYQQTHIHWGHYLRWPTVPFYSAMGSSMLLLDQVALLISVTCAVTILLSFWYKYKGLTFLSLSNAQFISLCYLAGSGASMILFQGGSLDSLGRYVFATAFIFPLFSLLRNLTFKPLHLIYIFIGCSLFFLLTGSLSSFLHFISNEVVALSLMVFYWLIHLNKVEIRPWNYLLIWAFGIALQASLFFMYLRGDWVE